MPATNKVGFHHVNHVRGHGAAPTIDSPSFNYMRLFCKSSGKTVCPVAKAKDRKW
jgi:hypothetical protein